MSYHCDGLSERDSNQFQAPLIAIARKTFKLTQQTLAGERITEWARLIQRDIADGEQRLRAEEAKRCVCRTSVKVPLKRTSDNIEEQT